MTPNRGKAKNPTARRMPSAGVTGKRAGQMLAQLWTCSDRPVGREPTLVLDESVDSRELGYADYGTRAIHLSPLVLTLSEHHVASLLAHELGHLAHGPAELSRRRRQVTLALFVIGFLCVLAGALTSVLTTTEAGRHWWTLPLVLGGVLLALCGPAMSLAQSRHAEYLADRYAAALLSATPWDASAVLRDAVRHDDTVRLLDRLSPIRLMDTHPSHRSRLKRMNKG